MTSSAPLALYGGTFDPVHAAHVAAARAVAAALGGPVHLLPNAVPPHRPQPYANAAQRLAMLQLAAVDAPELKVDDWELRQPGPSYTLATLEHFRQHIGPERPLVWVVGADSFASLHHWHRWQHYPALCHLAVLPRPGAAAADPAVAAAFTSADAAALRGQPAGLRLMLTAPCLEHSSTAIRTALAAGQRHPGLDAGVADFIYREGLYNARHLPTLDRNSQDSHD